MLSEVQIYECWGLYQRQPKLDFLTSDWIDKWVKWENGKKNIITSDTDTQKYFQNHSW